MRLFRGSAGRTRGLSAFAVLAALLVAVIAAVYWPSGSFDFVDYDDRASALENPLVRHGLMRGGLGRALEGAHAGFWIPVTWLSYLADLRLFGAGPGGFHATNVAIHCANAALFLLVLWRLTGALWRSALAAALFALHPLRVESVAWIAQRKDVLAACFFLLSLLAYGAWVRRGGKARYAAVGATLALGLLSKPVVVGAPVVYLLLDYWPLGRLQVRRGGTHGGAGVAIWRALLVEKLPLLALSAVLAAVALAAHQARVEQGEAFTLLRRLELCCTAYFEYARRFFWPQSLALVTASLRPLAEPWRLGAAALGLAAVSLVVARRAVVAPFLATGWLWYLVLLFPTSGIIPAGAWATADRFTYLPLAGICICVVWWAGTLMPAPGAPRHALALAVAGVATALMLALASRSQLWHWRDTRSLFTRSLAVDPADPMANLRLGSLLVEGGDLRGGAAHLRRTLEAMPGNAMAHESLGLVLARLGDLAGASRHFAAAVAIAPEYANARFNLGVALGRMGKPEEAVALYRETLRLRPEDVECRYNLALTLRELGRGAEAAAEFEELRRQEARAPAMPR